MKEKLLKRKARIGAVVASVMANLYVLLVGDLYVNSTRTGIFHIVFALFFVTSWLTRADEIFFGESIQIRPVIWGVVSISILALFLGIVNEISGFYPKDIAVDFLSRVTFVTMFIGIFLHCAYAFRKN